MALRVLKREEKPEKRRPSLSERMKQHGIKTPVDFESEEHHGLLDLAEKVKRRLSEFVGPKPPEELLKSFERLVEATVEGGFRPFRLDREHVGVAMIRERFGREVVDEVEKVLNRVALREGRTDTFHFNLEHVFNAIYTKGGKVSEQELEKIVREAMRVKAEETTVEELLRRWGILESVRPHLHVDHLKMSAYAFVDHHGNHIIPAEVREIVRRAREGEITQEEAWRLLETVTREENASVIKVRMS